MIHRIRLYLPSALALLFVVLLSVLGASAHADGKITAPPPSISSWKIADLRFPLLNGPRAIVAIAYLREDGTVDRVVESSIEGSNYPSFLAALSTSSGAVEATIKAPDGSPDLAAIFNLRLSKWLVSHGIVPGATADAPTPATTT